MKFLKQRRWLSTAIAVLFLTLSPCSSRLPFLTLQSAVFVGAAYWYIASGATRRPKLVPEDEINGWTGNGLSNPSASSQLSAN